ncbi:MAG TPA: glycosyltransferase [Pseudomonadales bacterium]
MNAPHAAPDSTGFSTPTPLVTVAIPAYNHGRYLAEAIDSVLGQDYPAVEIIVIDDGSTDETPEVLARYAGRVEAVSQANAGQSETINRAWRRARGEVVAYLSADDRLKPHAVSTAVAALRADATLVMVYGDFDLIDPESRHVRRVRAPEFEYRALVSDLVCPPGPGAFVRRSAVERAGGWDPSLKQSPDFEFWLRVGLLGRCARIPDALADLRVHPGSISFAPSDEYRCEEPIRIMRRYFAETSALPAGIRALERESLASAHLLAGRLHLRAGRYRQAGRAARAAAALCPRKLMSLRAGRLLANALVNRAAHEWLWRIRGAGRRKRGGHGGG